jgi:hypothetical protein
VHLCGYVRTCGDACARKDWEERAGKLGSGFDASAKAGQLSEEALRRARVVHDNLIRASPRESLYHKVPGSPERASAGTRFAAANAYRKPFAAEPASAKGASKGAGAAQVASFDCILLCLLHPGCRQGREAA